MMATLPISTVAPSYWLLSGLSLGVLVALLWVQLETTRRDASVRHKREADALHKLGAEIVGTRRAVDRLREHIDAKPGGMTTTDRRPEVREANSASPARLAPTSGDVLRTFETQYLLGMQDALARQTEAAFALFVERSIDELQARGRED
jgi:hypothetical protein